MSLLADFLEAFYGTHHNFRTVFARVHHESQSGSATKTRRMVIGKAKPSTTKTDMVTTEMIFWAELPDRVRVEIARTKGSETKTTVEVLRGHEHLKRKSDGSVEVESENEFTKKGRYQFPTQYARHFDRGLIREFFSALMLERVGECQIAGRDCVRIRALPINGDHIWPHWLSIEADTYEFAGDLALPSLLSIRAFQDGALIESHDVVEVKFDEPIDEAMFTCEPVSGQAGREAIPVVHRISPKTAAARVPFRLLFPAKAMGEESPIEEVLHCPARDSEDEHIAVFLRDKGNCQLWYHLRARPEREMARDLEWEPVESSGRMFRISDPDVPEGLRVLSFELAGTCVEIFSDLPRSDLFDFALSLQAFQG